MIVKKGDFAEGDKAVYIEIDSLLPSSNPDFAFLEKKKYRIKTLKMKGVISQGIAFPLSILPVGNYKIGDDVTSILDIKKIEDDTPEIKPSDTPKSRKNKFLSTCIGKYLMRFKALRKLLLWLFDLKGKRLDYPAFVKKTDEERLQNMPWVLEKHKDVPMVVTEKLDGTSTTFALERIGRNKFDFAVCSRNVRLANINKKCYYDKNHYWDMALKYDVEYVLKILFLQSNVKRNIVLQGETIGEGIQKNKYQLKCNDFYAFNLVIDGIKMDSVSAAKILKEHGIKWVPILEEEFILKDTIDSMTEYATGKSTLCDTLREGIVIRDIRNSISFKVISPEFLLKWGL